MARGLWWRIGVPAMGLAAAVAVGWRLSSAITVLVIACAWLPLAAWCLFAPRIPAALPVALALLAAIGTVWWTLPGQPGDRTLAVAWSVLMWYPLPGGLALLTVTWRSRWLGDPAGRAARPLWMVIAGRSAGPAEPPARPLWLRAIATVVATAALVFGCGCGGALSGVGMPSADELFPLPAGMDATRATGPDGADGCDQTGHACWTSYRITGAAGESTAVLTERLQRHLQEARGWDVKDWETNDEQGPESCRPVRRVVRLTAMELCITVTGDPDGTAGRPAIGVELSMSSVVRGTN